MHTITGSLDSNCWTNLMSTAVGPMRLFSVSTCEGDSDTRRRSAPAFPRFLIPTAHLGVRITWWGCSNPINR